jgi:hypothetical protein
LFAAGDTVKGLAVPPRQVLLGGDEEAAACWLEQADPVGAQCWCVGGTEDFEVGAVGAHQAFFGGDPEGAGAVFADAAYGDLWQALFDHPAAEVVAAKVRRRRGSLGGEGPCYGKNGKNAGGSQKASPGALLLRNTVTRGLGELSFCGANGSQCAGLDSSRRWNLLCSLADGTVTRI